MSNVPCGNPARRSLAGVRSHRVTFCQCMHASMYTCVFISAPDQSCLDICNKTAACASALPVLQTKNAVLYVIRSSTTRTSRISCRSPSASSHGLASQCGVDIVPPISHAAQSALALVRSFGSALMGQRNVIDEMDRCILGLLGAAVQRVHRFQQRIPSICRGPVAPLRCHIACLIGALAFSRSRSNAQNSSSIDAQQHQLSQRPKGERQDK